MLRRPLPIDCSRTFHSSSATGGSRRAPGRSGWAARHFSSGGTRAGISPPSPRRWWSPLQCTYRARGPRRKPELEPARKRRGEPDAEPARVEVRYFL